MTITLVKVYEFILKFIVYICWQSSRNMTRIIVICFIVLCLGQQAWAGYDLNANCKRAWMLVMDLEFAQAEKLLAEEISENPDNYYAYYLQQTSDLFKLMINSSDAEYESFVESFNNKREIMDGKDEESPYYLSCFAEMELQVAVVSIMHGSQWSGLKKGYAAYKKVYRNLDKFPEFKPSLKMDGFFNVAISNLPPFVKWAVSFFGVKVDREYGFNLLEENYQSQKEIPGVNAESALYIILAAKINKTPEKVYEFTKTLNPEISRAFIHAYFRANIAYRTGKNEEALAILNHLDHQENDFSDVIYSYLMGKILLRKQDPKAEYYLSRYLSHLEKKEYLKEMNYNLALVYLLNGDRQKYLEYCELVQDEGMDLNERDREALYDAKLDYTPDVNLVKARLLLEGGYLDEYKKALRVYEANQHEIVAYKLEHLFLKARFDVLKNNKILAIAGFKRVIKLGEGEDYYFASEAALRLGNIYQETGKLNLAKEAYEKSIKLYKNDYYEYIEDKARKALKSL